MQYTNDMTMKQEKHQPNAFKWLSHGLQENAIQSVRGDVGAIAHSLGLSEQTVRAYLKGEVHDLETGKKVLAALRQMIIERERSVKQLIA